ncbi:hypothetical protein CU633_05065 [Bacillus sp. V3-13]|uniref:hypothetical protein n=1 Tax=Bacillus sp. V3-13 TaxID=2053728 RepID=UPI000C75B456|nr:hypothetical protein [Bacillus sp. V3-13]PLR78600.1 hypothetical protein CU633_05065 [Bacillus sp. V3-13]
MTNHPIYKLFSRDMAYSLSYGKYKYLIFYCIIAALSLMTSLQLKSFDSNSVGTFYLLLKDNGYIKLLSEYEVPVNWTFIQFFVLFLIGDFLFQDIGKNRSYLLLRCRSKGQYILAKMGWIVAQSMILYIGVFVVIYFVSSLVLCDFSIGASPFFTDMIAPLMEIRITPGDLILRIILGYFMTTLVLSSIQLLCIQFISPAIAYFGVIILGGISTFSDLKWLPAIHSMILKQTIFDIEHQLTLRFSILYSLVLYVLISIITFFVFKEKDIL